MGLHYVVKTLMIYENHLIHENNLTAYYVPLVDKFNIQFKLQHT